jgi:hypothetical protein
VIFLNFNLSVCCYSTNSYPFILESNIRAIAVPSLVFLSCGLKWAYIGSQGKAEAERCFNGEIFMKEIALFCRFIIHLRIALSSFGARSGA